jgi:hypothetical protein
MSRSSENDSATPRRRFIGELAASAAALAAVACTPAAAATSASSQAPAPSAPTPAASTDQLPGQSEMKWDTSWMARITAKHKAVFDSPEINDGNALYLADSYFGWVKNVFGSGESDASVVVVLRHSAVPLLYNDAMWSKYPVGSLTKTVDPKTKASARRNTFYRKLDKDGKPSGDEKPSATIDLATRGFAYEIAQKTKQNERSIYEDLRSNLVPAATLMTTGIFATLLAQEAGCSFMSAS